MSYSGPLSIAIGVEKNPSTVIPMTETDDETHRDMWKPSLVFSKQTAHFHVVFSILSGSDHETLVHLPLNAELFCEDDGTGGAETHDQVKEERGRDRCGVVRGEDQVIEEERKGEVEDEPWASDEAV